MARTVVVELPDWVLDALGVPEDRLAQELRKGLAVVLYVGERVSLREAAGLAGMPYADFVEYLGVPRAGHPVRGEGI